MLLTALSKAQKAQTATYRVSVAANNSNDGRTEETRKYIWMPTDVFRQAVITE